VAHIALLWESGRNVTWIVRALKIFEVAADASSVCDVVVCISVALAALQSGVSTRQRPSSRRVIERRRVPVRSRVAYFALLREAGSAVVRIVRALKVFQMAANASRSRKVVVAVGMALRTRHADMRSREREASLGVIESRRLPG